MLTVAQIKALRYDGKPRKYFDGDGLFLLVMPAGNYWRLNYRYAGRAKTISLGVWPETSLADARAKRDEARRDLAAGIDPSAKRKAEALSHRHKADATLETIAREWFIAIHAPSTVASTSQRNLSRLERLVFPRLGARPIGGITALEVLHCLQAIEHLDTAHRVKHLLGKVWRFAVVTGRATADVTAALKEALPPFEGGHHPAITEPKAFGQLLRALDAYQGSAVARAALRIAPYIFVRPIELRHMRWADLRLDDEQWDFTPSKGGAPMITPLAPQVVAMLRELHPITGRHGYVFASPSAPGRPISDMTLSAALARLDYKNVHTTHGFRATARTILDERLGFPLPVIEMQLAHAVRDANGNAYNRTTYLEQRTAMMRAWADYCDALREGSIK